MNKLNTFINKSWYWIIIVLGIIVFTNSLLNPFVLDDSAQVTNNPAVHSISNIPRLFLGSTFAGSASLAGVYYKPLMTSSYALLYSTFGATPFVFHLFQIALHIANAILVYLIFKKFLNKNISLLSALVFLVHPINSESVIYVSGLQEPLFFFFGCLAFLQVIGSPAVAGALAGRRLTVHRYVLFGVFMACSLLSKETGLAFLAVSVFYRFLFKRNDFWKLVFVSVVIFIVYFGVRFVAVGTPVTSDRVFPITRLPLYERILTIPESVFYYLRNFFFPHDFAVAQHWVVTKIDWQYFGKPLFVDSLFVGIAGAIGIVLWRRNGVPVLLRRKAKQGLTLQSEDPSRERPCLRAFLFFLAWFVVGMALHLNILPLDFTVADRWFYFPMVGLLGLLGVIIQEFLIFNLKFLLKIVNFKFEITKTVLLFLGVGIIVALSIRTMVRNYDWRSGLALASRDVKYSRDSFPLENNLGFELINANNYKGAEVHVKRSVELGPWWWLNWNNLGVIYRHNGQYDKAEEAFSRAVANTNTFYMPYENLAELLLNEQSPKAAVDFIVESSKKLRLSGRLWFLLSLSLSQTDDQKAALQAAQKAAELAPNDPQSQVLYQGLSAGKKIQLQKTTY